MHFAFVPLLSRQREIYEVPRGPRRFAAYLRALDRDHPEELVAPLLIVNPMAREPVVALVDELLVLDADGIAQQAVGEAASAVADVPGGPFRIALVVADDAGGGWTNRYAWELAHRFERPPAAHRDWRTGVLWSGEPADASIVREAVLMTIHREAWFHGHGPARTLRERLVQEGEVMCAARCTGPILDPEEIAYTREVLRPHLETTDLPTAIVHLFGDPAARSLGYRPAGLSLWAGLALAWHDARTPRDSTAVPCRDC